MAPTRAIEVAQNARADRGRRARRLPYVAAGATAAAGYGAWGLSELAQLAAGPAGEVVVSTGTAGLCAAALGILRLHRGPVIPERWRRRLWTAGASAASWVTAASAVGPVSWPMTAALVVGTAAASASWLRAHEVPTPPSLALPGQPIEKPVRPAAADEDPGVLLVRRWTENIAADGKPVPGSLLTERVDLPHAIRWTVQTIPGSTSFSAMFAQRDRIAAGLRWGSARVLLEPSDVDESAAVLTVITKDILKDGIAYTGPRYRDGVIELGPYADGSGWGDYVAVDGVGCRNGMATGEPGSGKSAFLEAVAMGLKSSGEWVVLFGDGDPEGGSSPLLNNLADWAAAGPQQVLHQLEALEAALIVRGMLKPTLTAGPDGAPIPITDPTTQTPVRELRPSRRFPAIKWILDELHRLSADPWLTERRFIPRLEQLVRIGRKYGIVVLTGSQSLLAPDYGNSTPLRGYLAARNLYAFRNGNKSEKAVVSGLEIAPSVLPPGGGYAFSTGSGRLAMLRVAWSPDMARHADGLPATALDPDTELAIARFRPAADADPTVAFAEQAAKLAVWRAQQGAAALPSDAGPASRPAVGGLAGLAVPSALTTANVVPIHRPAALAAPATSTDVEAGPDLEALNSSQRIVVTALKAGHRRTGAIAAQTGLRLPAVSKALSALADLGLAERVAHGSWVPAGAIADPAEQSS
ncbi:hypothetical protein [Pseudonocardia sp. D17]|uniref:hypothetical protein n=1 Tax=Pseudonocardia sp. D17 TaxID=882661 RepID=UPI002B3C12F0|nr:hypothetical protein PSD17_03900 [Pseudonocardia sp. D17]